MKVVISSLLILVSFSCSSVDSEPWQIEPVITFKNKEGSNLFDDTLYNRDHIRYYSSTDSNQIEVANYLECESLLVLPDVVDFEIYVDFGNNDIDTISYEWDGGNAFVAELINLNWLEVYYNHKLVKRWQFENYNERSEFSKNHCNYRTCPTDCNSPDVIEIIKEL